MTPPPGKMSKLFGSLGADESSLDARTQAAANDAKQRWPMFKSIAPQSSEVTPLLSDDEKSRWSNMEPVRLDHRPPALSRPGLSAKLFKGLTKIARQTSAEVLGSAKRASPHLAEPQPPVRTTPEPAPVVVSTFAPQTPLPSAGLFAAPAPMAPAPRAPSQFLSQPPKQAQPSHHHQPSAATRPADDSLLGIFQRIEGNKPKPLFFGGGAVAKVAGVMSRLGKR